MKKNLFIALIAIMNVALSLNASAQSVDAVSNNAQAAKNHLSIDAQKEIMKHKQEQQQMQTKSEALRLKAQAMADLSRAEHMLKQSETAQTTSQMANKAPRRVADGTLQLDSIVERYTDGTYSYRYNYAYDENGNEILNESYYWGSWLNMWIGSWKSEYAYDDNGYVTLSSGYMWDYTNNVWAGSYKSEYAYNEEGRQILYVDYSWNSTTQSWDYSYKCEDAFDENGYLSLDASYNWDSSTNTWIGSKKYEYAHDEAGHQTLSASYTWDYSTNTWSGVAKTEWGYDEAGNTILYVQYNWDYSTNTWIYDRKYEYAYDEAGRETFEAEYIWNSTDGSWLCQKYLEEEYDAESGRLLSFKLDNWDETGTLTMSQRDEYTYDEEGNTLTHKQYFYSSDYDLATNNITEFSYNDHGYIEESRTYSLGDNDEKTLKLISTYYYTSVTTDVKCVERHSDGTTRIYNLDGKQMDSLTKGINIIKTDGKTRKVVH